MFQQVPFILVMNNCFKILIIFIILLITHFQANAQQITEKDVPTGVKKVAIENSNNQPIISWVKDSKRGKYIATIINNTLMRNIEITLDGKLMRTSDVLQESQLPISVRKTIQENYLNKGFKGKNYLLIKDAEKGTYYAADVSSEDDAFHVTIDPSGKLIKAEVR